MRRCTNLYEPSGTSAPKCTDAVTQNAYAAGVEYAVQQLSLLAPRVALYLAVADGRQLGWGARVRFLSTLAFLYDSWSAFTFFFWIVLNTFFRTAVAPNAGRRLLLSLPMILSSDLPYLVV